MMKWENIDWVSLKTQVSKLQKKIVVATEQKNWKEVKQLQQLLVSTFAARALSVKTVTSSSGQNTAGIDEILWATNEDKIKAILDLKKISQYKAKPVKRVYIPKDNGKLRPLGIPTLLDRAFQALFLMALDPIAETYGDSNSFGFRKNRSQADAIAIIYKTMASYYGPGYVLDADIKGFFDNISHSWITENIPMDKKILKEFLKAGYIEKGKHAAITTSVGVPQGGVISPTIANMVLDFLQETLRDYLDSKNLKTAKITFVRYADDFIVIAYHKWVLEKLMPVIQNFLKLRGLELNLEKTKIINLYDKDATLDYLGWTIERGPMKKGTWPMVRPSDKSITKVKKALKELYNKDNTYLTNLQIIERSNLIVMGWANYFKSGNSTATFGRLTKYLWKLQFIWACAKYKLPKKLIVNKFFDDSNTFYSYKNPKTLTDLNPKKVKAITFTDYRISKYPVKMFKNPYKN